MLTSRTDRIAVRGQHDIVNVRQIFLDCDRLVDKVLSLFGNPLAVGESVAQEIGQLHHFGFAGADNDLQPCKKIREVR